MNHFSALSFALAGLGGLAIVLGGAPSGATGSRTVSGSHSVQVRRNGPTPDPCLSDAPGYSFVGIAGAADYASESDAAVLGGTSNEACASSASIGGGTDNTITAGGGFIGGGEYGTITSSEFGFIGAGNSNYVGGDSSFIGAGDQNHVLGYYSVIGGGTLDMVSGNLSFIGAGAQGSVSGIGSFIGAGDTAYSAGCTCTTVGNAVSGNDSFLGAGDQNVIAANQAFVGAGQLNSIGSNAIDGAILAGNNNDVGAAYGTIGGGSGNRAEGAFAAIPGGADNEAFGAASFAAGYHAFADHNGSFVWSDNVSGSKLMEDTAANEFVVRASGGVYVYSSEALTSGVKLAAGSGAWASLSDRNAKTDIVPVDDDAILAKVAALPVSAWRYKTEHGVRHVGPMAQDFYAAFGVGEDDRHITSIDEDGVALAAIKALRRENAELRGRLDAVERRLAR